MWSFWWLIVKFYWIVLGVGAGAFIGYLIYLGCKSYVLRTSYDDLVPNWLDKATDVWCDSGEAFFFIPIGLVLSAFIWPLTITFLAGWGILYLLRSLNDLKEKINKICRKGSNE